MPEAATTPAPVTDRIQLARFTAALRDPALVTLDFTAAGLAVTGIALRQIAADIETGKIAVHVVPQLGERGLTDMSGGKIRIRLNAGNLAGEDGFDAAQSPGSAAPLDLSARALVVHEAVHAVFRKRGTPNRACASPEEAASWLAEALVFALNGESIVDDWAADNPEYFHMPYVEDPYEADSHARIYVQAQKLIDKFALAEKRADLTAADIAGLVAAIAKDPGYDLCPAAPQPKPAAVERQKTWCERARERRRKRRARRQSRRAQRRQGR